jgi:ubiquinone biosynthesis protein UbiJ
MGILDKVKQVAGDVGVAAKKGAGQVQSKVEQSQTRKKANEAAEKLGYLIVKERTEGTPGGEEADKLVAEIVELEKQLEEMAKQPEQPVAEAAPEGETSAEGEAKTE